LISFNLTGDKQVQAYLLGIPDKMRQALVDEVDRQTRRVHALATRNASGRALDGGLTLKRRTGTLRRSINSQVEVTGGSVVGTVGIKLTYAAIHEFGFEGTVNVAAHLRKVKAGKSLSEAKKTARGRSRARKEKYNLAQVKAHTRKMKMPERSYLRSALRELKPSIIEALKTAIRKSAGCA